MCYRKCTSTTICETCQQQYPTNTTNMPDEQRLFYNLMRSYEKAVRPVRKATDAVVVKLGITLTQIMDIEWKDVFFKWSPDDYNRLKKFRIPCRYIWLPDIVLYNSADDYTQGYMQSLAMIEHDGTVFWPPIVKFRSTCKIDITWFPFDDQLCFLKFGSWTYDSTQITLVNRSEGVDMTNYVDNESGEKVSLGLTVLLAFSVFMLLIAESMPATSEFIPLIGEKIINEIYLLYTEGFVPILGIYFTIVMGLTSCSVLLAVMILNIHLYGSSLTPVPKLLRKLLFIRMAPVLCVKLHRSVISAKEQKNSRSSTQKRSSTTVYNAVFLSEQDLINDRHTFSSTYLNSNHINTMTATTAEDIDYSALNATKHYVPEFKHPNTNSTSTIHTLQECKRLLGELNRIILSDRPEKVEEDEIMRDWQNVALVIDRLLFYTYIVLTLLVTLITLVIAPLLKTIPLLPEERQLNLTKFT
ncbi:unnamed protein product [Didymodactylos carnosus]|uniref:Uncharacterized protein n=1 Tax=Didymodactylos carnosus TaxID=1234261 RepID=A0A813ZPZ4_9BILA|nr:unnamed protein product [Didymodactylos carnosus]CAF1447279.1 unnamed protein product [Didymodactylos carnosus]CAF3684504.1 unnamed protein product [Didymodactylos carnosus]CAF4242598.1 unnamed protein product [Didymodactylos carnosus]